MLDKSLNIETSIVKSMSASGIVVVLTRSHRHWFNDAISEARCRARHA